MNQSQKPISYDLHTVSLNKSKQQIDGYVTYDLPNKANHILDQITGVPAGVEVKILANELVISTQTSNSNGINGNSLPVGIAFYTKFKLMIKNNTETLSSEIGPVAFYSDMREKPLKLNFFNKNTEIRFTNGLVGIKDLLE